MNIRTSFTAVLVVLLAATVALAGPEKGNRKKGPRAERGERAERSKGEKGKRKREMSVEKMLERIDANANGQIELDEAPERMKSRFEELDADSNGAVSQQELKAVIDKMKERRAGAAGERGPRGERGARGKQGAGGKKPGDFKKRGKGRPGKGGPQRPADDTQAAE